MKKQLDSSNTLIKLYGCHFYVLGFIAETIAKYNFSDKEIIDIYNTVTIKRFMNENCFITNPQEICNEFLKYVGCSARLVQVGTWVPGKEPYFYPWVVNAKIKDWDWEIIENRTENGLHFTHRLFDPYPGLKLLGINKRILYKVF